MDSRAHAVVRNAPGSALDFVRFCHRRRRVGWPELYDEMCAVASRGLYHGWTFSDLAEHGIAFGLAEMSNLRALVDQVAREEADRRGRVLTGVIVPLAPRVESADEDDASKLMVASR